MKRIEATLGPIDVLVNNAGVMEYCKMANAELDWWLDMVRVNCDGFLHTIAAVLPTMKERQSGHIVNITSDAARKVDSCLRSSMLYQCLTLQMDHFVLVF